MKELAVKVVVVKKMQGLLCGWAFACLLLFSGCAAFHPIRGISSTKFPEHYALSSPVKDHYETIDLSLLRQPKPAEHIVGAGDTLGIFVEGVLGKDEDVPPVLLSDSQRDKPALGYPIAVRNDGTISLPYTKPIEVSGLTIGGVERKIREIYTRADGLLKPGRDRIFVTLQKPRTVRVLVVRRDRPQDQLDIIAPDTFQPNRDRQGSAVLVELPAFENDILHALVQSGGLPGVDAENAVYVMRNGMAPEPESAWQLTSHEVEATAEEPPAEQQTAEQQPNQAQQVVQLTSEIEPHQTPQPAVNPVARFQLSQSLIQSAPVQQVHQVWNPPAPRNPFGSYRSQQNLLTPPVSSQPRQMPAYQAPQPARPQQRNTMPAVPAVQQLAHQQVAAGPQFNEPLEPIAEPLEVEPVDSPVVPAAMTVTSSATINSPGVTRIPLSVLPGEPLPFGLEDIILHDGDVLYIESRQREFFFTGGLLGGGKYPLPRDYELDVMGAIAIAESNRQTLANRSIGGASWLNQDVTVGASRVIVMRTQPDGKVIPIKVDLKRLKRFPEETVYLQPGDRVFLQYTQAQAIAAFFERHFLEGAVVGAATSLTFGQ